ncbi:hypothetical protein BSKO_05921 [Bryopsis sp. KO-2023]|nr:hypothetical protein BSKO_05921 [Bryopsis sp. KO-2023]
MAQAFVSMDRVKFVALFLSVSRISARHWSIQHPSFKNSTVCLGAEDVGVALAHGQHEWKGKLMTDVTIALDRERWVMKYFF